MTILLPKYNSEIIKKSRINESVGPGVSFEAQNFPDAPNQAHFPDAVLKTGETYCHKTRYKFEIS